MKGAVTKNIQSRTQKLSTNLSSGVTHNVIMKELNFKVNISQYTQGNAIFNIGSEIVYMENISVTSSTIPHVKLLGRGPHYQATAKYSIGFAPTINSPPVDMIIQPSRPLPSYANSIKNLSLGKNRWLCVYIDKNSVNNITNENVIFNIKMKAFLI